MEFTEAHAMMMMNCAALAVGKVVGAEAMIEHRELIENIVREAFCNICEENHIDEVKLVG